MPEIGQHVIYTVPPEHETKTVKGPDTVHGSIFHPEQRTFAGVIGRVHPNNSADLHLFVPNRDGKWVDAVHEGEGPGTYRHGSSAPMAVQPVGSSTGGAPHVIEGSKADPSIEASPHHVVSSTGGAGHVIEGDTAQVEATERSNAALNKPGA